MRHLLVFCFLIFGFSIGFGQSSYIGFGNDAYHIYDRLEIKSGIESPIHSSLKYYTRKDMVDFISRVEKSGTNLSDKDLWEMQFILDDNNEYISDFFSDKEYTSGDYEKKFVDSLFYTIEEKEVSDKSISKLKYTNRDPVLRYFYKTPANFFELDDQFLKMKINPILNIKFGKDFNGNENVIFQNTRGIELRGTIDDKVYFYTSLVENQGQFNDFLLERINRYQAIPGFGSYKDFTSTVSEKFNGFDFPNSQAYVGFNISPHIGIEFGHNRHFIGNGYNSLLLSDYANNYFYLKFSTKVWKLHYQNIFAELAPISDRQNIGILALPKKYLATHYLSIKPTKNIEIGLFETVIFSRQNRFEFQYLNPVILYRTVEFFLDSPDNVLIGLNGKWNFAKRFSLYGQLILDEFNLSELKAASGWWANKYGIQAGLKYIDAFSIDHLDFQFEYNLVRPYTFSHRQPLDGFKNSIANYSHFNQPLAHPLGANLREFIFLARYKPLNRLSYNMKVIYAQKGEDYDGLNWGGDILKPSGTRVKNLGNTIGQGTTNDILQIGIDVSYQFHHNYYFDIHFLKRTRDSTDDNFDLNTNYIGAGIRGNIGNLKLDY